MSRLVAVDVETAGTNPLNPFLGGKVRLVSIDGEVFDVYDSHERSRARNMLNNVVQGNTFLAHNAQFDLLFLRKSLGYKHEGPVFDTQVAWQVLTNGRFNASAALDNVVKVVLDKVLDKTYQKFPYSVEKIPDEAKKYAAMDTLILRELAPRLEEYMRDRQLYHIFKMEMDLLPVLVESTLHGITLDQKAAWKLVSELDAEVFETSFYSALPFNPKSAQQVARYFDLPDAQADTLRAYSDQNPEDEIVRTVLDIKKLEKKKRSIQNQLIGYVADDGRIHPSYTQCFTETGRLCVAKGTPVEIVRDDVSKEIPIEDVTTGDLAYTFNDNMELTLKPVVWSGRTGHKRVVRIYWRGTGNKHSGHLDVTPDHPVRLVDGSYKEAQQLSRFERIASVSRGLTNYGYHLLYPSGQEPIKDHRFVYNATTGQEAEHVHHADRNKLNNTPQNLVGMSATEHTRLHGIHDWSPERRARAKKFAKDRYNEIKDKLLSNPKRLGLEKQWMLDVLWANQGKPTAFRDVYGIDYATAKRYLAHHDIDWRGIRWFFSSKGRLIDAKFYDEVKALVASGGIRALSGTGVGYYKWKEIEAYFQNNHVVLDVVELDEAVDVYDIEVADTHNFIANELCIHNSSRSPNLQNQDKGKDVRSLFVAPEGRSLVVADYSQLEVRIAAMLADEKHLKETFGRGISPHEVTCREIFNTTKEDKRAYTLSKNILFASLFGGGSWNITKFAYKSGIKISEEEAEEYQQEFFKTYPRLKAWHQKQGNTAPDKVFSILGRRRFVEPGKGYSLRINHPVQSSAADGQKLALTRLYTEYGIVPATNVHDEIMVECASGDAEEVKQILERVMTEAMYEATKQDPDNPKVHIEVEGGIGRTWEEAK